MWLLRLGPGRALYIMVARALEAWFLSRRKGELVDGPFSTSLLRIGSFGHESRAPIFPFTLCLLIDP